MSALLYSLVFTCRRQPSVCPPPSRPHRSWLEWSFGFARFRPPRIPRARRVVLVGLALRVRTMFAADEAKFLLIQLSMNVNFQLAWRIWQRKHLHTVLNLGYCFYFTLSGIISIFVFSEYGSLLSSLINSGQTNLTNCHRLGLSYLAGYLVYKVFIVNIMFRHVLIKYPHYGMGKMGSLIDTKGWIMKLIYFTFLLSYGLMVFLGMLLKFSDENSFKSTVKGKICLLEK